MKNKIRLFIGDMEVQFNTEPEIYYNYTETDLTNPTVVKNSYSKTITIGGTPENNKIFGQFWDLERMQEYSDTVISGTYFNPSHKTPFTLYVNSEIYESGYVKLDEVRKIKGKIEYDITLYGGLGEFFYLLSYGETGDKLKLSDLNYTTNGGDEEFNFSITKDVVNEAWNNINNASGNNKWKYINFAPCYNGNPDGLSADKVVINFRDNVLPSSSGSYHSVQGFALGTLPSAVDEWVVRDLRSWNQRPVIKTKEIIKACERYAASAGYSVDYDEFFFNNDNPYWTDAWITLPKLDEIKINGESGDASSEFPVTVGKRLLYNGWYDTTWMLTNVNIPVGTNQITIEMNPYLSLFSSPQEGVSGNTLYSSCYANGETNFSGYLFQLIGYDGSDFYSNVVAASDAVFITSKVGNQYLNIDSIIQRNPDYYIKSNKNYSNVFGTFEPLSAMTYKFSSQVTLTMDNTSKIQSYAIRVMALANLENVTTYRGEPAVTYGYRRGRCYTGTNLPELISAGTSANYASLAPTAATFMTETTGYTYSETDTAGYSGAKLSKKLLLDTEYSPCEYLLSYAKLFGLYFYKEPHNKIIHIMARNTFYNTGTTINIEDKIDRSKDVKVTPIAFESKWYDMQWENVAGECANKYNTTYGKPYGIQRINTGYNFDSESNDLFKENSYKGAVECTEKSRYLLAPVNITVGETTYSRIPYYYYQGMTYELYDNSGNTTSLTPTTLAYSSKPLNYRKYYDAFSKVQLRDTNYGTVDGQNVLIFFNGVRTHTNSEGNNINYYLTDDLPVMGILNDGQACWISTESIYNTSGQQIAISRESLPDFGRYKSKSDYLLYSFDFGSPKELFIPDAVLRESSNIYYNYWQNYISDLYNVNTKVVECDVLLENKPSNEWLRNFYWFDNSIWRINKISDWKIGGYSPTKVEFIKVQDKSAFDLPLVSNVATLTLSASTTEMPLEGGDIQMKVTVSDGGAWSGTSAWSANGYGTPYGVGDKIFTYTVDYFIFENTFSLSVYGEAGQYSNSVTIKVMDPSITSQRISGGTIDYSGGTAYFKFISKFPWTAVTSEPSYTTISATGGTGSAEWQYINLTFDENSGNTGRTAYITISNNYASGNTPTVTQDYFLEYAIFTPDELNFSANTELTKFVQLSSNTEWRMEIFRDWASGSPTSGGSGNTIIKFDCEENTETFGRITPVTIKSRITNRTISNSFFINQYPPNPPSS